MRLHWSSLIILVTIITLQGVCAPPAILQAPTGGVVARDPGTVTPPAPPTVKDTPLVEAIRAGDLAKVRQLLGAGASPDAKDTTGATPLHWASRLGKTEIVALLLEKGAFAGVSGSDGTPLHVAANKEIARQLVEHKAEVNALGPGKNTPLHQAIRDARQDVVDYLLANGADVKLKNSEGQTPLHLASIRPLAEALITKGADLKAVDNNGYTPLAGAVVRKDQEAAEYLLSKGAEVNVQDKFGNTPLHQAVRMADAALVSLLLTKGADANLQNTGGDAPLHWATGKAVAEALLQHGAKPNMVNHQQITPLIAACSNNNKDAGELVDLLLAKGADVKAVATDGETALHRAASSGQEGMVNSLLKAGADAKAANKAGLTPLHLAVNKAVAAALLDHGAVLDARDEQQATPLFHAAQSGHDELVAYLLERGAKPSLANKAGDTPLHVAGNDETAQALIKDKAELDAKNALGETPLYRAIQEGRKETATFLLSKAVNVNLADNHGNTPLHAAVQHDNLEQVKRLLELKANPKVANHEQKYPLQQARSKEVMAALLDHGADANVTDDEGKTPLFAAAAATDQKAADTVSLLLSKGAKVNVKANDGSTPLHVATDVAIAKLLLENAANKDDHADPNAADAQGVTPLHKAVEYANLALVQLLLKNKADPLAKKKDGDTPLHLAGTKDIAGELLLAIPEAGRKAAVNAVDEQDRTPLFKAAGGGDLPLVQLLLTTGARVNVKAKDGATPLLQVKNYAIAKELLTNPAEKADPRAADDDGNTALYQAASRGDVETINMLLKAGVNPDIATQAGLTPLHVVRSAAAVNALLDGAVANLEAKDSQGNTPLLMAVMRGDPGVVSAMLARGANANATITNTQGGVMTTPLLRGAQNAEMVRALLKAKADPNKADTGGFTPLHQAAMRGSYDAVVALLNAGAGVTARTKTGQTPLHYAANASIAQALLANYNGNDKKAILNALDDQGVTPLQMALANDHADVVTFLLSEKASVTLAAKDGATPLTKAATAAQIDELLKAGAKPDPKDAQPLINAANRGLDEGVAKLLAAGANARAATKNGDTALHHTTSEAMTKMLLEAKPGAEVNAADNDGLTPLMMAAQSGHTDVVAYLLKHGAATKTKDAHGQSVLVRAKDGATPLHKAANADIAGLLHEGRGIDVNVKDDRGQTPLFNAVRGNHLDVVQYLLDHGAGVNEKITMPKGAKSPDPEVGTTPLLLATDDKIAELLIAKGARVDLRDHNGYTPLFWAVYSARTPLVKALLAAKASPSQKAVAGFTPLHQAPTNEIAQLLIDAHADVNAKDDAGATPLYYAIHNNRLDVAELLLTKGAKATATTKIGETAMHVVSSKEAVALLLKYHATLNPASANGMTPLHAAVAGRKLKVVEALLAQPGIKVNVKLNGSGPTPLHIAPDKEIAQLLLDHKADMTATSKDGATPLHWAAAQGRTDVVQALLDAKAKVDAHAQNGATPLFLAAANGQTDALKMLLEHHADVNAASTSPEGKMTPLYIAVYNNQQPAVEELLKVKGIDLNTKASRGLTPLHTAAFKGNDDIVELLLKKGAKVNAQDNEKGTPLHQAVAAGRVQVVKLLLEHGANVNALAGSGVTPLHMAQAGNIARTLMQTQEADAAKNAQASADEIIKMLVKAGANVNIRRANGVTLLLEAVYDGDKELVKTLLSAKECNVNLGNNGNETPLHLAVMRDNPELAKLLIEHHANVNAVAKGSGTPLHWASSQGLLDMAKLLVEHGAGVNDAEGAGAPPLLIASMRGNTTLVQYLLSKGADPKLTDPTGGTPLHGAARPEIVKMLLDAGANPNALTKEGIAPLHLAVNRGDKAAVKMLVKAGANVNVKTKGGKMTPPDITPLMIAHNLRAQPMIDLLKSLGAKEATPPAKKPAPSVKLPAKK